MTVLPGNRVVYTADLRRELRTGLRGGIAIALPCCAVAIIVYAVRGIAPFQPSFATLPALLAAFLTSGTAGGVLSGILHPWHASIFGRAGVGGAIALAACLCVGVFTAEGTSSWSASDWKAVGVFTAIGGAIGVWRLRPSRAKPWSVQP